MADISETPHRPRPKVPPFARYKGTSAWRKDRRRARAYALFQAAEKQRKLIWAAKQAG